MGASSDKKKEFIYGERYKLYFNLKEIENTMDQEITADVIHISEIDSTMPGSEKFIDAGNKLPFIYNSIIQTAGKGKGNRKWAGGIKGNLYTSTGIPMKLLKNEINNKDTVVKLTVISILQELIKYNKEEIFLKYPNDIVCKENKKMGGVLVQEYKDFYIIGFGINLIEKPDQSLIRVNGLPPCCLKDHIRNQDMPTALDLSIAISKRILFNINLTEEELNTLFEGFIQKNV
jgi:hypothetical protein